MELINQAIAQDRLTPNYHNHTLMILDGIGDRLDILQDAINARSDSDSIALQNLDAISLIDHMVDKYTRYKGAPVPEIEELGIETIADALLEIATLKNPKAIKALTMGSLSLNGLVASHAQRSAIAAKRLKVEELLQSGTEGTYLVNVDEETGLHLVGLQTVEHLLYEGAVLRHSLSNPKKAKDFIDRKVPLFSLRQDGIIPKATIEVKPSRGEVTQARRTEDKRLVYGSAEHLALCRSLGKLAEAVNVEKLIVRDSPKYT